MPQAPSEPVVINPYPSDVVYLGLVLRRPRTETLSGPVPRPRPARRSGLRPLATAPTEVLEALDPATGEILTLIRAPFVEVTTPGPSPLREQMRKAEAAVSGALDQ